MKEVANAMDVRAVLKEAMSRLREAGVPSHTLAAELLLMNTLDRSRAWVYAHPEESLDPAAAEKYFELVARRAAGTPTQYLTGKQEFWGLEFEVTPAVLIPRPETEHVIEVALERIGPARWPDPLRAATGPAASLGTSDASLRIADVGTGSGCLAVSLARELPGAEIIATDISAPALEVARRNAARHGVSNHVLLVQCNLLDSFLSNAFGVVGTRRGALTDDASPRKFDLIVSNPPYIRRSEAGSLPREVREHEPPTALFAGESGIEIYAPLVGQAAQLLRNGGILVLELGCGASERVRALLEAGTGWTRVSVTNDLSGIPRVISAERA